MFGKDMTAAGFAPLAMALRGFGIRADILLTPRNLHAFRLPQGKGVDGTSRPMAALTAMTIAHACGLAGHGELDCATETISDVTFWAAHNTSLQFGLFNALLVSNPTAQLMGPRPILAVCFCIVRSDGRSCHHKTIRRTDFPRYDDACRSGERVRRSIFL